jgi:hypothetical protein
MNRQNDQNLSHNRPAQPGDSSQSKNAPFAKRDRGLSTDNQHEARDDSAQNQPDGGVKREDDDENQKPTGDGDEGEQNPRSRQPGYSQR